VAFNVFNKFKIQLKEFKRFKSESRKSERLV